MLVRFLPLLFLVCLSSVLHAQTESPAHYQLYGGYTFLSNSFNGVPGARQPLNGWDASLAFQPWHNLRFKLDTYAYSGTNLGAPQKPWFIMAGGQYGRRLGRESVFVEALVGDAGINKDWGPNRITGGTATFATLVGGGVDTPIARHFAYRATGGFQYSYTDLAVETPIYLPYRIPGLPTYFARISTGLVWLF
ncbi:MAG TPA: hypothetical protein VGG85_01185 [Terracidiphilus sp.]|jgi:hypothetical protein